MDMNALFSHLSTQLLQIVAIVVNLLITLVAASFRVLTRKRKKICYETMIHDDIFQKAGGLQIYYNRTIISKPGLLEMKIRNIGNIEISHFKGPVKFIFGTNTRILQVDPVKSNPKTGAAHRISPPTYQIAPLPAGQLYEVDLDIQAMNAGDCVSIQFLLNRQVDIARNEDHSECKIQCDIIGVPEGIVDYKALQWTSSKVYTYVLAFASFFTLASLVYFLSQGITAIWTISLLCFMVIAVMLLWKIDEMQ